MTNSNVITAVTAVKFNFENKKEIVDMCQALQEMCDNSRAEGIVLIKAEGELQKAREIAINLHAMGLRVEQIAKGIGCTVETVKECS